MISEAAIARSAFELYVGALRQVMPASRPKAACAFRVMNWHADILNPKVMFYLEHRMEPLQLVGMVALRGLRAEPPWACHPSWDPGHLLLPGLAGALTRDP